MKHLVCSVELDNTEKAIYEFICEDESVMNILFAEIKKQARKCLYKTYHSYKELIDYRR